VGGLSSETGVRDELRFCPRCAGTLEWRPAGDARLEHPTCTACGFVVWQNPKPSVEALIVRERDSVREVLLGRRPDGGWDAPGNFLNADDRIEDALMRECRREMGIDVRVEAIVGAFEDEYAGSPIVTLVYRCAMVNGEPRAADIIDEVGWFPLDALPPIAFRSIERALAVLAGRGQR
jgi:ADP-ribose pyrophosphatase YjhB (NUDIX family)